MRHDARNLAFGALAGLVVLVIEAPIASSAAHFAERRAIGLLPMLGWSSGVAGTVLGVLLMDYSLYGWHVLTHKAPWLWRLHRIHHSDLDLTATTALRFHFAEVAVSIAFRVAQVILIGLNPRALLAWQGFLGASILFHHSNARLPARLERLLGHLVMTPRLHGIHHSSRRDERDSNWSSGLTVWDFLHRTLRRDVPQDSIEIGLAEHRRPEDVRLRKLVGLLA